MEIFIEFVFQNMYKYTALDWMLTKLMQYQ